MGNENKKKEIKQALAALGLDPLDLIDYNKLYEEAKRLKEEANYYAIAVDNIERHVRTITEDKHHNPFTPTVIVTDELSDVDLRFYNNPVTSFSEAVDVHETVIVKDKEQKTFVLEYSRKVKSKKTRYKWAMEMKKVKLDLTDHKRYHLFTALGDYDEGKKIAKDLLVTVNYLH